MNARICGYTFPHEVAELVRWFRNGSLADLLSLLGAELNAEAIASRLDLVPAEGEA